MHGFRTPPLSLTPARLAATQPAGATHNKDAWKRLSLPARRQRLHDASRPCKGHLMKDARLVSSSSALRKVRRGATDSSPFPGSKYIGRIASTSLACVLRFVFDAACKYLFVTLRFE